MHNAGLKTFTIIWSGQLLSQIGTAMTRFALLFWAYEQTGSVTALTLLGFSAFMPLFLISPLAGVWVDRIDRRKIMLLADLGAGVITAALLLLYSVEGLAIWHLYLAELFSGLFGAFQQPAYTAATSTLLPKEQYARASGLRSLANFGAQFLAPALGGLVLSRLGLAAVLGVDLLTFFAAFITLALIRLPSPAREAIESARGRAFWQELRVGFLTIKQHRGLSGLVAVSTAITFFASLTWFSVLPAMILARSQNSELALAGVQSAMGIAGVLGGVLVSLWGGPRRKVRGFLGGVAVSFLVGDIPLALGRSLPVWIAAGALGSFFIPILDSAFQAIWQSKVDPARQGRVFTARDFPGRALTPVAYLLSGVLADRVLEPAMMSGGSLAPVFGRLVGVGPGSGMALMFLGSAVSAIVMCLLAYLIPAVHHLESDVPDYDTSAAYILQIESIPA